MDRAEVEASSGASGYEIEIDGETIVETEEPKYLHINLAPCTRQHTG